MQIRSAAHLSLSRRVATESLVLLENKNNTLPLSAATKRKIAVVGPFADCQSCYFGEQIFKLELQVEFDDEFFLFELMPYLNFADSRSGASHLRTPTRTLATARRLPCAALAAFSP